MTLGEHKQSDVPVIGCGCPSLATALGCGGYPRGRVVEIYGPESSGKTTLTLHAIAECQKAGGVAAFVDAEHALDVTYESNDPTAARELIALMLGNIVVQPEN